MFSKLFLLLAFASGGQAARILALMVVLSPSHHLWNVNYLEALAKRGHEITYLSVDEYKKPSTGNIRNFWLKGTYEAAFANTDFTTLIEDGPYMFIYRLQTWDEKASEYHLGTDTFKRFVNVLKKEKFDLVVHDIPTSHYLLGAVDLLGRPPVIGITAFGVPAWTLEVLGNPMSYASRPYFLSSYPDNMSLLQRIDNFFLHFYTSFLFRYFLGKQNELSVRAFGPNVRPIEEIAQDINIFMVNINIAMDPAFPMVPGLIPIGGLHIKEPKPLPEDLKRYLDEASHGVVYFSLGTNIKSSGLKPETLRILTGAFQRLSPVKVLWKYELDSLPDKPENVKIVKWLPQNDILAHPNVKIFFTHSGLLGTQEGIYHGKALITMPFFLDQHVNSRKCVRLGLAEELKYDHLTVDLVEGAIRKVLTEPRYMENAKNISALFRDQITNPMEKAIYWTEYAIRHKGAPRFRFSARNLTWYQNWMLDIWFIAFLICAFLYFLVKSCFASSKKPQKLKSN